MYFDAIAHTPTQTANARPAAKRRDGDCGVMINAKISAVM
jgi:hypothetical protein